MNPTNAYTQVISILFIVLLLPVQDTDTYGQNIRRYRYPPLDKSHRLYNTPELLKNKTVRQNKGISAIG